MIYFKGADIVAVHIQQKLFTWKALKKNAFEQFNLGFWNTGEAEHAIWDELGHAIEYVYTDKDTKKLEKYLFLREEIKE